MKKSRNAILGIVIFIVVAAAGITLLQKSSSKTPSISPTPANSMILESDQDRQIQNENVIYYQNINGFFAYPKDPPAGEGKYPGVVMIHEWWGLNDNIKDMAVQLAREGYQVLAVDLFQGNVAKTAEEARTQTSSLDQDQALDNLKAAVSFLKSKNASKIASLGWCFGGGQSMQLSVSGEKLDATVIYYGNLISDKSKLVKISWPILGIFGDKDQSITVEKVKEFENAVNELGIKNYINIYPGVGHAFANPSGAGFAPQETKDAWDKTLRFLKENLKS